METSQISHPELNNFLEKRRNDTLAIAQQITKEVVERENALMDFELLFSVNTPKKEEKLLTQKARELRDESWKELNDKFGGDFEKINRFVDSF